MHENLKYLGVGGVLLKRLLAGDFAGGTLRSTLKEQWKEPRDCLVEISPGVVQVGRGFTPETCWDITYKQLWMSVLREFADLGGRAPLKEPEPISECYLEAHVEATSEYTFNGTLRLARPIFCYQTYHVFIVDSSHPVLKSRFSRPFDDKIVVHAICIS